MIEHLVLSGAGTNALIQLGLLNHLIENDIFILSNIKSIYATSAGAIISILLLIGVSIIEIRDYLIQRPWEKFFNIDLQEKGIFQSSYLYDMIKPFMLAYDIPDTFTLLDLYNKSGVDLHIFTTKINGMISVDLNYVTFPTITLSDVIKMTSSVPILFPPFQYENEYYIDGGILNNCPLQCIEHHNYSQNTILIVDMTQKTLNYNENSSILDFMNILFSNIFHVISADQYNNTCKNKYTYYYCIITECIMNNEIWSQFINNIEYRQELYDYGYRYFKKIDTIVETN
jgi:predicted acylesterase/phospholipase RssA